MYSLSTKFLCLLLVAVFFSAVHQPVSHAPGLIQGDVVPTDACQMENTTFEGGEEIVYKVYYNWNFVWLSAGEVVFRVKDNGSEYHVTARGRTYSSYEWFFKVRDNYESFIDKNTLLPRMSIRDVNEGNYTRYDRTTFDQRRRRATSFRGKTRDDADTQSFTLEDCMHDVVSVVYYFRNIDFNGLNSGQKVPVKVFLDRESHPLKVNYMGKDDNFKLKGMGHYRAHTFSPELVAGEVFKEGDKMTVWVSNDKNQIPLMIESPVSVGSVKVVLKSYRGLRYPFTAKR